MTKREERIKLLKEMPTLIDIFEVSEYCKDDQAAYKRLIEKRYHDISKYIQFYGYDEDIEYEIKCNLDEMFASYAECEK